MVDPGYCTASWLVQQIKLRGGDLLVLDCRPSADFSAGHVLGAVHLLLPAILLRRLHSGKLSTAQMMRQTGEIWHKKTFVLYDGEQLASNSTLALLLLKRIREDGYTAYLLEGTYTTPPLHIYIYMSSNSGTSIVFAELSLYYL